MDIDHNTGEAAPAATADLAVTERLEALTRELSALMGQYSNGRWFAIVGADDEVSFVPAVRLKGGTIGDFLEAAPTNVVVEYHLAQLTLALRKRQPGMWIGRINADWTEATVVRREGPTMDEAWINFEMPS